MEYPWKISAKGRPVECRPYKNEILCGCERTAAICNRSGKYIYFMVQIKKST